MNPFQNLNHNNFNNPNRNTPNLNSQFQNANLNINNTMNRSNSQFLNSNNFNFEPAQPMQHQINNQGLGFAQPNLFLTQPHNQYTNPFNRNLQTQNMFNNNLNNNRQYRQNGTSNRDQSGIEDYRQEQHFMN